MQFAAYTVVMVRSAAAPACEQTVMKYDGDVVQVMLSCHGCRSGARTPTAHAQGCGRTSFPTMWGWTNAGQPGQITWVAGTLEASYARVSAQGTDPGWCLASADPISEYRRVLAATRKANQ